MDLSQAQQVETGSLHCEGSVNDVLVGTNDVAAESDDEEFLDANDSFVNMPMCSSLGHLPTLAEQYRDGSNFGTLERCGQWLMAIPRNDVMALQQTIEYRIFLAAFDKLGEVG